MPMMGPGSVRLGLEPGAGRAGTESRNSPGSVQPQLPSSSQPRYFDILVALVRKPKQLQLQYRVKALRTVVSVTELK